MAKPYLIIVLVEGVLNQVNQRPTKVQAEKAAVTLAVEQCDSAPEAILAELKKDGNFMSKNGDIRVYVTQVQEG